MDQILENSLKSDAPIGVEFLDTTQIPLEFVEPTFERFYNWFQADNILNELPEPYFSAVVRHALDSTNEKNLGHELNDGVDLGPTIQVEKPRSDQ